MNTIRTIVNPNKNTKKESTNMATPNTPKQNQNTKTPATTAAKAAASEPKKSDADKKRRETKVRLYSQVAPEFYVRVFQSFIDKHGIPEHGGKPMQAKAGESGAAKGSAKKAEREAEKAKLAAMSDEEKLAYAKTKREQKKTQKEAKKNAERDALIAQLKAEIAAGKV